MYAGYQHPGGYYDEQQQQAFDPYAVPPEGYQQGFFPQNATAYGYPAQQQQYYAPYGMAAGYGYDPSMMAASMPPAMGGMTYSAQQATMGMQQQQQQQQYQPLPPPQQHQRGQATPHRPASSTPSNSSSMRPNASSNGAAAGSNTQQSHLAAGAGAKQLSSTLDPSISAAPTTSASPSSTSSPRPQGQGQGSLGSSLGGLSSLPPRPNFEPATSQFSSSAASSNHINGATLSVPSMPPVASVAPPYAGGAVVRPAAVPRLGSQMMQQQQSEGGASSISNKGNVLGVQLLEKLPPLPPLPPVRQDVPAALSWLQSSSVTKGGSDGDGKELGQNAAHSAELDDDVQGYITSLHEAVQAYQRREEAMQLRLEAMAFRPTESWTALRIERGDEEEPEVAEKAKADGDLDSSSTGPAPPASVLGVRLLRKVMELQRENEELGALLSKKLGLEEKDEPEKGEAAVTVNGVPPKGGEVDKLLGDLEDAHSLLSSLSTALTNAETRASKAEAALQVAVQSRSKGIMDRSDSATSLSSSPPQQPRHNHHHHQQQQQQQSQQVAGAPSAPRQQGSRQHNQQQQRAGKPKQKDGKTATRS